MHILVISGGNTHTGRALAFGLYTAMSPSNGARPYISKAALVLTDGRSQDLVGNPAREMRQAGVKVISILCVGLRLLCINTKNTRRT